MQRLLVPVDAGKDGVFVVSITTSNTKGARGESHDLVQQHRFRWTWPWWTFGKKGPTWLVLEGRRQSVPVFPGQEAEEVDAGLLWALVNQKVVEDALRAEAFGERMRLLMLATAILAGGAALLALMAFQASGEARDAAQAILKLLLDQAAQNAARRGA